MVNPHEAYQSGFLDISKILDRACALQAVIMYREPIEMQIMLVMRIQKFYFFLPDGLCGGAMS
jgi:hypothetical protein